MKGEKFVEVFNYHCSLDMKILIYVIITKLNIYNSSTSFTYSVGGSIYYLNSRSCEAGEFVMSILIIDGQGGGVGRGLVEAFAKRDRLDEVIVLGANSAATSNMIRGFNVRGATGENAVVFNCQKAEVILGPIGIIMANAMLGEITPRMAEAVSSSGARIILVPMTKCHALVVGVVEKKRQEYIDEAVEAALK
jgi:hypothetical protein